MKISRIARVVKLLTVLQSGKSYTVDDLAEIFKISRRTVFRDLQELRAIGVPYTCDLKTATYKIDPEFFLPPIDLNLQEALSILLLVHKAAKHIQLPFKSSALLAALKIENNLPVKIRQYCNIALDNISIKAGAQAPANLLDKLFAQLQAAITKKRKVNIKYHSLFEGQIIDLELCPYHLMYNHRAWYILGFSSMHKSIRTFKLNRIKELQTSPKCFINTERFDLADYLGRAWSIIPEGKIYHVKLRFLTKVANNVTEVLWHSTQQTTHNDDGSVTMEFRVDGIGEIFWWILGYGDQVQVLAPKILQQKIIDAAHNIIAINTKI